MEEDLIEEIISVSSYKNKIEKVPPLRFVREIREFLIFAKRKERKKGRRKICD